MSHPTAKAVQRKRGAHTANNCGFENGVVARTDARGRSGRGVGVGVG